MKIKEAFEVAGLNVNDKDFFNQLMTYLEDGKNKYETSPEVSDKEMEEFGESQVKTKFIDLKKVDNYGWRGVLSNP